MKHVVIGTAGHIDHGKTTLIRALTGRNTDRWAEEQRRGITIDLGFTFFDLPNGNRAGIIDVPGHEKFISNMTAGVVGMDLVLVVIAADEGMMPQTREHLDILKLLGIESCIFVLNKCDLVEEEWIEMIEEEIRAECSDSFLQDVPIMRVSAVTGEGIAALTEEIQHITEERLQGKEMFAIPRLPIDRAFTMSGFGTVVTGTLLSGRITKKSNLEIYPIGKECKIRNIQVYGIDQETGSAGQRVAVNLSNVKKEEVRRGCVLAPADSMKNTTLLDVRLNMLESSLRVLGNRTRLHLFTGTSEVLCRAVLLEQEELRPGEGGYVQLRLEEEIAVQQGDRFVVRFYSPAETIGGGVILDANPRVKKRFRKEVIEELRRKETGNTEELIEFQLRSQGNRVLTAAELAGQTGFSTEEIVNAVRELEQSQKICCFSVKGEVYVWHRMQEEQALYMLQNVLEEHERLYPYRLGIGESEIRSMYFKNIKPNVFARILKMWKEQRGVKCIGEFISTVDFEIIRDEMFREISEELLHVFQNAGYNFIKYSELVLENRNKDIQDDVLHVLEEDGIVVKVCQDYYSLSAYMDGAEREITELLEKQPVITISQVKDVFRTSRKCAKQILEYTDTKGITKKTSAESEWMGGDFIVRKNCGNIE